MFGGDGAAPSVRFSPFLAHGDIPIARDRPNPTPGALTVAGGARGLKLSLIDNSAFAALTLRVFTLKIGFHWSRRPDLCRFKSWTSTGQHHR